MDTLLEEAIDSWQDAWNGVIEEVENLPADRFDFRPGTRPQWFHRGIAQEEYHRGQLTLGASGAVDLSVGTHLLSKLCTMAVDLIRSQSRVLVADDDESIRQLVCTI